MTKVREYVLGNYGYQVTQTVLDQYGEPYDKVGWQQYYILQIGMGNSFERFVITDGYFNVASFETKQDLLEELDRTRCRIRWTAKFEDE
ncbi:hypothetical protein [Pleurocapsa sp. FMAR1]|uniref:hypothetical protein n=1 Tax=Pleurocapsa sp. FMAR1 TaxID=3040204 RepID=UPI0029C8518E|nr:hypothetical protein [Pleurocapsa sp. FMAR1]